MAAMPAANRKYRRAVERRVRARRVCKAKIVREGGKYATFRLLITLVIYHELANLQAQSDNILTIFSKTAFSVRSPLPSEDLESLTGDGRLSTV
jgi:hypothetical protein